MKQNFFHTFLHSFIILTFGFLPVSCGIFSSEEEQGPCSLSQMTPFDQLPTFTDFGCEEGYFIYKADMEKTPWTRNRNFLSIEFYEELDETQLHEILDDYDLFYHSRVEPTKHVFARVKSQPAEAYYTTYGDTTQPALGNRPEVKYALPVFMNEFWQPLMIADRIMITFNDGFTDDQELAMLDSLKIADHLTRLPMIKPPYLLQTSKATPKDPLSLVIHYMETLDAIQAADPVFAFMIN
ncbi:MAG: hypothetical protein EA364_03750 [Balneolaceae bacterium]|nr:MAG: hypothetical protein EA364_03750 [Balneolaceae bacterium]